MIKNSLLLRAALPTLVLSTLAASLSGCNVYDIVDNPSGADQYRSAARACFDSGDFECARENYAKLAADDPDTAAAENMYVAVDEAGAKFSAFLKAFFDKTPSGGKRSTGASITALSDSMIAGSGAETRKKLLLAYKQVAARTTAGSTNENIALAKFLGSLGILAEIFAEDAATAGTSSFTVDDLAVNPTTCKATTGSDATSLATIATACAAPTGAKLTYATTTATKLESLTEAEMGAAKPTTAMVSLAVTAVSESLQALGAGGGISSTASSFTTALSGLGALGEPLFRQALLNQGIGATE